MTDFDEFGTLLRPANPGDDVALGCPACPWRSDIVTVKDEINGTWHALHDLGGDFRLHFDSYHRPLPNRLVRAQHFARSATDEEAPHAG